MTQHKSMRGRLVRIMLVISGLTGIATFGTVALLSAQTSARHLAAVQKYIEEGIVSKGKVLTENHARALRSLILDNAFLDIQRLVERAVQEDSDVAYGVFVSSNRETLALARHEAPRGNHDPLAKDAWQSLGLDPSELLVEGAVVTRVTRLGQDLLEVAVPVTSDDGERLGTVRYGLSTRRMHDALAHAAAEGRGNLLASVAWIGGLVGVTTLLGLLLSRSQALRITRPIADLTNAARALATGDRSVKVDISSGDELELLGASFNHMADELGTSYRRLEEMNRTLEQKVEERTRELALKNRDMLLVLDNVDQGFATLSPGAHMTRGRSRVVGEWFGEGADEVLFSDYISQTCRSFGMAFEFAWSQVSDGCLPLELALDQLPRQLTAGARTWSFRYLPFFGAGNLEGVLVVVDEITQRLLREREEAEQRDLMQSFVKLMLDKVGFMSFLKEADQMVNAICSRSIDEGQLQLKRALHTLKGNAGVMGLSLIANLCHELEDQLQSGEPTAQATLDELADRWHRINAHVVQFIPDLNERAIEIAASEYAALIARLSENESQTDLLEQVLAWGLEPAVKPLERLAEQARTLARRLGKDDLDVKVRAGSVRLDPDEWRPFFAELLHVVRNAVDHGIEPPMERAARAKPAAGQLVLEVQSTSHVISFEISDDGRGIDWANVRSQAERRGLPHATPEELLAALCHDGITTRTEITDTSGRGVGMAAFRHCVESMKGTIDVKSSGLGTTWFIRFPLKRPVHPPSTDRRESALPRASRPRASIEPKRLFDVILEPESLEPESLEPR